MEAVRFQKSARNNRMKENKELEDNNCKVENEYIDIHLQWPLIMQYFTTCH